MASSNSANTVAAANRFRKASSAYRIKATKSKASANKTLVKLGIYTPDGKLSKEYE